jgi:hypothetical protein
MAGLGAVVLMGHERAFRITPGGLASRSQIRCHGLRRRRGLGIGAASGHKEHQGGYGVGDDQLSAGQLLNLSHNQGSLNCLSRTANLKSDAQADNEAALCCSGATRERCQ